MIPPSPILDAACTLIAAAGVVLAVVGLLTLSLPLMGAGTVLWMASDVGWEFATGRFA